MKQFNGYEEAKKAATAGAKLPVGAYVCKILDVKYEEGKDGKSDSIAIRFDIAEGEQKDFFKKQYEENTSEDKKWKGKLNIYVPTDDGSERDSWTKRSFAGWTKAFEDSNDGYSFDWDEKKWKGLLVGIVFGETGAVINGKEIKYTEARFAVAVSKVRDGSAPVAKFKARDGYTGNGNASTGNTPGFMSIPEGVEEEIPF